MVLQHRIHLVSRYPHSAVGCAAAAVSTYYCATIKKRKKTGHALEDTKHSMLLCTWRHISFSFGDIPPFKHENICQSIILSLSLSSQPSSSSKRKEKVLVAFFENISVADILK
jgi:hypothetical protein